MAEGVDCHLFPPYTARRAGAPAFGSAPWSLRKGTDLLNPIIRTRKEEMP